MFNGIFSICLIDKKLLLECFNNAITNETDIDLTINQFEASMIRLTDDNSYLFLFLLRNLVVCY